jgi:hypothetical protein
MSFTRSIRLPAMAAAAVCLFFSGCGGSKSSADSHASRSTSDGSRVSASAPTGPTGMELRYDRAVMRQARLIYSGQNITTVECHKNGFNTAGDTVSCTLSESDGTVTEPSDWLFIKGQNGNPDFASVTGGTSTNPEPSSGNSYSGGASSGYDNSSASDGYGSSSYGSSGSSDGYDSSGDDGSSDSNCYDDGTC